MTGSWSCSVMRYTVYHGGKQGLNLRETPSRSVPILPFPPSTPFFSLLPFHFCFFPIPFLFFIRSCCPHNANWRNRMEIGLDPFERIKNAFGEYNYGELVKKKLKDLTRTSNSGGNTFSALRALCPYGQARQLYNNRLYICTMVLHPQKWQLVKVMGQKLGQEIGWVDV